MMVVTRGTTPTIRFKLPFETDVIQNCEVYLSQPNLLIVKRKNDCILQGNIIQVPLTEDETLQMSNKHPLEMQIRFEYTNGSLGATRIKQGDVGRILKEGKMNV